MARTRQLMDWCRARAALAFVVLVLVVPGAFVHADALLLEPSQLDRIGEQYGAAARRRVSAWQVLIRRYQNEPVGAKLEAVNRFFNQLEFVDDRDHWGREDYWATPIEFLGTNGGDCEDFAIAKYFTLRALNVPVERMRITYVKSLTLDQAHMVLAYYERPDAEPLVLDNIESEIKPASRRNDLIPVYSFNGDNLWLAKELSGRGQRVGGAGRISLWQELLQRMQAQHLDPD